MTRRSVPPRRVEALAIECRELLAWLKGPGQRAGPAEFAVALSAYRALAEAVAMLPRGPEYLKQVGALMKARGGPPAAETERPAEDFTLDELATMPEAAAKLTPTGWVVAAPLLPHVEAERASQGPGATYKSALTAILRRKAAKLGQSELLTLHRELGALEKRVSLLRAEARARDRELADLAVTQAADKVPPDTP